LEAAIPRILIVDDHDIVRHGVRDILETQDEWEVVGEGSDGFEAIQLNERLKPDAVVMDINMPRMNGLEATHEIMKLNPNCKVLILTVYDGSRFWPSIQNAGAKGLVSKSRAIDELTPALKAIISGETYFH
jgi:two-component system response regulator DegU